MKRLFTAIRLFCRTIGLPKKTAWTDIDTGNLSQFLSTATGAKLRNLLLGQVVALSERAADDANAKSCGIAVGYRAATALIISLGTAQSANPEVPPNGREGNLDHLRP